ncbi:MAG: hypothetical protein HYZ53_14985 [Planctomycetes bacterium]|nr:hypothetical protein [Planctomycetota bacterium]
MEEATPVELQLARLDQEIAAGENDIREALTALATSSFEREEAARRLAETQDERVALRRKVEALHDDLKRHPRQTAFTYEGREYSRALAESDLRKKLCRMEALDASIASRTRILEAKGAGVGAGERTLIAMEERRAKLEVQAEGMRSEFEELKGLDQGGQLRIDSSRIAYAEGLAESIRRRLGVSRKMLETRQIVSDTCIDPTCGPNRSVTELADAALGRSR